MSYYDVTGLAPYIQYTFFFVLILASLMKSEVVRLRDFNQAFLIILLFVFSGISILNGYVRGLPVNAKPLVLSCTVLFLEYRRVSRFIYETLFKIVAASLVIEYALTYSGFFNAQIGRFFLIRPFGIFADIHLTSYYFVFAAFLVGYRKFSLFASVFFASLQSTIAYVVLVAKFVSRVLLFLIALFVVFALWQVGHLNPDPEGRGMLMVILGFLQKPDVDIGAMLFGYGIDITNLESRFGWAIDIGFLRAGYQFGFLWLITLTFVLRKYSKSLILAHYVFLLHYPLFLGVLGFVFFIFNLQYEQHLRESRQLPVRPIRFFRRFVRVLRGARIEQGMPARNAANNT